MGLISALVVLAAPARLTIKSTPEQLVLGVDKSAQIIIDAPGVTNEADVRVTVNIGTVSKAKGNKGHFVAVYTPPAKRFPQVALFYVDVLTDKQHAWLVLPLPAKEALPLETKPSAKVEVTIGDKTFGPVKADKKGQVTVPVVVPPGIDTAAVRSVDLAGNEKNTSVPLDPPPFVRVSVVAPQGNRASWADPAPLPLEACAITRTGAPAALPDLLMTVNKGVVEPLAQAAPGVFVTTLRAPDSVDAAGVRFRVEPKDAPSSGDELKIATLAGPPAGLDLKLDPPEVIPGSTAPVLVQARVIDAKGNFVPGQATVTANGGVLKRLDETKVHLFAPAPHDTRELKAGVVVEALYGDFRARNLVRFKTGQVASLEMSTGFGLTHAGADVAGRVLALDLLGNPVDGIVLEVRGPPGKSLGSSRRGHGRYKVAYRLADDVPPGPAKLEVRYGSLAASQPITILPKKKRLGMAVGLSLDFTSNLFRAHSFAPNAELALRVTHYPIELLLAVGGRLYIPIIDVDPNTSVTVRGQMYSLPFSVGVRTNFPLSPRWATFLSGIMGGQLTWASLSATAVAATPRRSFGSAFLLGVGWGMTVEVGPGRILAEVVFSTVGGGAGVNGNIGGMGLRLGYLYGIF